MQRLQYQNINISNVYEVPLKLIGIYCFPKISLDDGLVLF